MITTRPFFSKNGDERRFYDSNSEVCTSDRSSVCVAGNCTPNTLPLHLVAMRNNMPVLCMFLQRAHNITRASTDDATFAKCKAVLILQIFMRHILHYLALRNAFPEESANLLPSLNLLYGMGAEFDIENNAGETMRDVANSGILHVLRTSIWEGCDTMFLLTKLNISTLQWRWRGSA